MKHIVLISMVIALSLQSCKKLDPSIQGYFFVQNTTEEYTLMINDKKVGILPVSDVLPLPCEDSTLIATLPYEIAVKKNNYELINSNGETVAKGVFRLSDDGNNVSARSQMDLGTSYSFSSEDIYIMGFNTVQPEQEYLLRCSMP